MKANKLREMSEKELDQKLAEARKELFNLRFQMAAGQLENTHRLKELRIDIARIFTIKEERKLTPQERELIKSHKSEVRGQKTEKIEKQKEQKPKTESKKPVEQKAQGKKPKAKTEKTKIVKKTAPKKTTVKKSEAK